jgi:type IV pilus assembly protein PilC
MGFVGESGGKAMSKAGESAKMVRGNQETPVLNAKFYAKKVKLQEVMLFAQQLSSMLGAGLQLSQALGELKTQIQNRSMRVVVTHIYDNVITGMLLSDAIKMFPRAFPAIFVNMVEAGEAAGSLPESIKTAADYIETTVVLTKSLKKAMVYPILVLLSAVGVVCTLLIFVIPSFADMFTDFGARLPGLTRGLIDLSTYLHKNVLYILGGVAACTYLFRVLSKTRRGSRSIDVVIHVLPIVRVISQKTNVARFCRSYSVLLSSGIPIVKTVEICKNIATNTYMARACEAIDAGVREGRQLSSILSEIPYFPSLVVSMARGGEQSGNIEAMMGKVADLYEMDARNLTASLVLLVEPLTVCALGIVVGIIVLAMFLPIFNISSVLGR